MVPTTAENTTLRRTICSPLYRPRWTHVHVVVSYTYVCMYSARKEWRDTRRKDDWERTTNKGHAELVCRVFFTSTRVIRKYIRRWKKWAAADAMFEYSYNAEQAECTSRRGAAPCRKMKADNCTYALWHVDGKQIMIVNPTIDRPSTRLISLPRVWPTFRYNEFWFVIFLKSFYKLNLVNTISYIWL